MQIGDKVFFYHSELSRPGIAGIAEVSSAAVSRCKQFDRKSPYFEPEASASRLGGSRRCAVRPQDPIGRSGELRSHHTLSRMRTLARGNRLSITPVSATNGNSSPAA